MSNKYTNFVSPRGTAKYPKLDQPYKWSSGQNKSVQDADGQYEVAVVMGAAEAAPFVKLIQDAITASGIDPQNKPFKKVVDKDTGKPTGDVEFKFKAYGKDYDGNPQRIKFFDAKAKPIPSNLSLSSGSIIKVEGYVTVAKLGARLNIRGVQVISLAEAPSSFGEEEGYEYTDQDTPIAETHSEAIDDDSFDF